MHPLKEWRIPAVTRVFQAVAHMAPPSPSIHHPITYGYNGQLQSILQAAPPEKQVGSYGVCILF